MENIAASEAKKEMIWSKIFLRELGLKQWEYAVYYDSQSAMNVSKNATYHALMKYIDVRYHLIREVIDRNLIKLEKIQTNKNSLDMMTKVLSKGKL